MHVFRPVFTDNETCKQTAHSENRSIWYAESVPHIRIDVKGYLTPYFLINRVKSKLKGFSDCVHSHNMK